MPCNDDRNSWSRTEGARNNALYEQDKINMNTEEVFDKLRNYTLYLDARVDLLARLLCSVMNKVELLYIPSVNKKLGDILRDEDYELKEWWKNHQEFDKMKMRNKL